MPTRGLIIEHHEVGAACLFGDWLQARSIEHDVVRRERGERPPTDPREVAWLAAFGSWHSAADTEPGWIGEQIRLFERATDEGVPALGICFGSQALAVALGGEISLAEAPFIGWFEPESADPDLVPVGAWYHHNYEVFSLPPDATELARSNGTPTVFAQGRSVGIQFHPEVTPDVAQGWAHEDERFAELGIELDSLLDPELEATARSNAFRLFDAWRKRFLS